MEEIISLLEKKLKECNNAIDEAYMRSVTDGYSESLKTQIKKTLKLIELYTEGKLLTNALSL